MNKTLLLSLVALSISLTACNKNQQAAAPVQEPATSAVVAAPVANESAPDATSAAVPAENQAAQPAAESQN